MFHFLSTPIQLFHMIVLPPGSCSMSAVLTLDLQTAQHDCHQRKELYMACGRWIKTNSGLHYESRKDKDFSSGTPRKTKTPRKSPGRLHHKPDTRLGEMGPWKDHCDPCPSNSRSQRLSLFTIFLLPGKTSNINTNISAVYSLY